MLRYSLTERVTGATTPQAAVSIRACIGRRSGPRRERRRGLQACAVDRAAAAGGAGAEVARFAADFEDRAAVVGAWKDRELEFGGAHGRPVAIQFGRLFGCLLDRGGQRRGAEAAQ